MSTEEKVAEVVAAVIERDGLILIGQRKNSGRHALKWEFPGGKVEPGETKPEALARELREELAIRAVIGAELARYDIRYGTGTLTRLYFFSVNDFQGEPENLDFTQIVWERPEKLRSYDFLEGDIPFVETLAG